MQGNNIALLGGDRDRVASGPGCQSELWSALRAGAQRGKERHTGRRHTSLDVHVFLNHPYKDVCCSVIVCLDELG